MWCAAYSAWGVGVLSVVVVLFFFFQAEDGIRDAQESRGLGDVYKRQGHQQMNKRKGGSQGQQGKKRKRIKYNPQGK